MTAETYHTHKHTSIEDRLRLLSIEQLLDKRQGIVHLIAFWRKRTDSTGAGQYLSRRLTIDKILRERGVESQTTDDELLEDAQHLLRKKHYAGTKYLADRLSISKKKASLIFYKLGWFHWSHTRKGSTFCRGEGNS